MNIIPRWLKDRAIRRRFRALKRREEVIGTKRSRITLVVSRLFSRCREALWHQK